METGYRSTGVGRVRADGTNPLLECWRVLYGVDGARNWLGRDPSREVDPDRLPAEVRSLVHGDSAVAWYQRLILVGTALRRYCVERWAWSVPDEEAVDIVARYSPLVEVGAGRGYWAGLVSEAGGSVLATDENPPTQAGVNDWHTEAGLFHVVQKADGVEVAAGYPERTLLLCWPPYGSGGKDGSLDLAVAAYREAGGRRLVYVGEGEGGACGGAALWEEIEAHWAETATHCLPQWDGMRDWLTVYEVA